MLEMWRMRLAGALASENVSSIIILKMDQSSLRETKSTPTSAAPTPRVTSPCRSTISPPPLRSSTLALLPPPSPFTRQTSRRRRSPYGRPNESSGGAGCK
uniref:Uncharacterized protein n=1 Tax=Aegilops tauschii subsp. strangulata TaxID=200361 RepID=A0A453F9J9_AEGTS